MAGGAPSFGSTNAIIPGGGADVNPFQPSAPANAAAPAAPVNPTQYGKVIDTPTGKSYVGIPSYVGPNATPVPPTTSATFNGPPQGSVQAPAVVTAGPAEDQLTEMENALKQALTDMGSMKSYNAAQQPAPAPQTPSAKTPSGGGASGGNPKGTTGTNTGGGQSAPDSSGAATDTSGNPPPQGGSTLEDEINSILDNLSNTESGANAASTTPEENATASSDQQSIADDQSAQAQVGASLDAMDAGVYPLTPAEQAQVSDIRSTYASALATAYTYQQNVSGGGAAAAATNDFQMYAPAIALGNIRAAINAGSSKVGALNSKIVASQAKLTTTLQNNDYKTASKLYTQISSDIKLRTDEIGKIQTSVQNETKQLQTSALNVAKEQITALINSNKLSDTEKQAAITNKLKQGQLDEKTQHDLATTAIAAAKAAKSSAGTKPVSTDVKSVESWLNATRGADKYVDPNAYQQAFDSWVSSGYQAKDFVSEFPPKDFVNPANTWLPQYLESKTSSSKSSASSVAAAIQAAFPSAGSSSGGASSGGSTFKAAAP